MRLQRNWPEGFPECCLEINGLRGGNGKLSF
jgi:hypothetical protein